MNPTQEAWLAPRAAIFKALGHPTRLFIVETLAKKPFCVCELTELIEADTSTVSRHLSILKNAGVVKSAKSGTTVYYRVACDCLAGIIDATQSIVQQRAESANASLAEIFSAGE